jgi:3-oxoacyl-[acyl-carrier protein] reductase
MQTDLQHKNALVGGSSKGIGKAIALELAALGANVTLLARNEAVLKTVLSELDTSRGQQHGYLCADMTDSDALSSALDTLAQPIHIVVNNTGGPPGGPAHKASAIEFLQAFQHHLIANQTILRATLEGMKTAGYGRIINIISTSVKQPLDDLGVSNTIRGAVANWAKTLANELGIYGITVNNILPGATATDRLAQIIEAKSAKTGIPYDTIATGMQKEIPLRRFAQPEEIAAAAAFLASPAAGYITGINLPVDGGRTKSL